MPTLRVTDLTDAPLPLDDGCYVMVDNAAWDGAARVPVEELAGAGFLPSQARAGADPFPSLPTAADTAMRALMIRVERLERQLGITGEV
jgi:hypothetical protein